MIGSLFPRSFRIFSVPIPGAQHSTSALILQPIADVWISDCKDYEQARVVRSMLRMDRSKREVPTDTRVVSRIART